jgi:hypothetical protein
MTNTINDNVKYEDSVRTLKVHSLSQSKVYRPLCLYTKLHPSTHHFLYNSKTAIAAMSDQAASPVAPKDLEGITDAPAAPASAAADAKAGSASSG